MKEFFFKDRFGIDIVYRLIAWLTLTLFLIIIGFLINAFLYGNEKDIIRLLVPTGIILSAALASTSVMKSIENTNKIEKKKEENTYKYSRERLELYLNMMHHNQYTYIKLFKNHKKYILFKKMQKEYHEIEKRHYNLIIMDKDILSMNNLVLVGILTSIEINIGLSDYYNLIDEEDHDINKKIDLVVEKYEDVYNNIKKHLEILKKEHKLNLEIYE